MSPPNNRLQLPPVAPTVSVGSLAAQLKLRRWADMNWAPYSLSELEALLDQDLAECSSEERAFFATVQVPPSKWSQSPWGDEGGGFWVVAVLGSRVLWYNDIEHGFNVSTFDVAGTIPEHGYFCNQDPLKWALPLLRGDSRGQFAPPESLSSS